MSRSADEQARVQRPPAFDEDLVVVMVADAQRLFSEVLSAALSQFPDILVLDAHPTTAFEAIEMMMQQKPNVALLDLWMPGMDVPSVTESLMMEWIPNSQVIFLSWYHGREHVTRAMRMGAAAFIPKSADVPDVVEAVRHAHAQKLPALAEQVESLLETMRQREDFNRRVCDRIWTLTPRELQVVRQISTGRPVKEIAQLLGITSGTVKAHIRKILLKTEAQSQKQVVAMARFCGAIN